MGQEGSDGLPIKSLWSSAEVQIFPIIWLCLPVSWPHLLLSLESGTLTHTHLPPSYPSFWCMFVISLPSSVYSSLTSSHLLGLTTGA